MIASISSFFLVWLPLFFAWGYLHDVVPPGRMTQNEYALQYMVVGGIVCLAGVIASNLWFSACRKDNGVKSLTPVYRRFMVLPILVGIAGAGYLLFLGAEDAGLNFALTLLAGLLVYLLANVFGTPGTHRKYLLFG